MVVDQAAGIRPTTPDRKPLMGQHKDYKKLYLFNGLGAKGYLIAPNVSLLMADLILNEPNYQRNWTYIVFRIKFVPCMI
ncbi:MAG: FAD-dependent oxidoreductase [Flavobacteriia bacterium]|nr:FAD-dependent oxidoreductase [Flavobacteriia bacterium]